MVVRACIRLMEPMSIKWLMCFVLKSQNPNMIVGDVVQAADLAIGCLVQTIQERFIKDCLTPISLEQMEVFMYYEVKKLFILEALKTVRMDEFSEFKFDHVKSTFDL